MIIPQVRRLDSLDSVFVSGTYTGNEFKFTYGDKDCYVSQGYALAAFASISPLEVGDVLKISQEAAKQQFTENDFLPPHYKTFFSFKNPKSVNTMHPRASILRVEQTDDKTILVTRLQSALTYALTQFVERYEVNNRKLLPGPTPSIVEQLESISRQKTYRKGDADAFLDIMLKEQKTDHAQQD